MDDRVAVYEANIEDMLRVIIMQYVCDEKYVEG